MNTTKFLHDLDKRLPVILEAAKNGKGKHNREHLCNWIEIMHSQVQNLLAHGDSQVREEVASQEAMTNARKGAGATPGPWYWRGDQLRTRAPMGRPDSWEGWIVPLTVQHCVDQKQGRKQWGNPELNRAILMHAPETLAQLQAARKLLAEWSAPTAGDRAAMVEEIDAHLARIAKGD